MNLLTRILHSKFHIPNSTHGFTLVELLVTCSIIAIMTAIGASFYVNAQTNARDARRKQDLRSIVGALELFYQVNKRYPCAGEAGGVTWLTSNNSTDWLIDKWDQADSRCDALTTPNIAPKYINQMPLDPKHDSSISNLKPYTNDNYGYGYHNSRDTLGTCTGGNYFILVTQLENRNDSERLGNRPVTVCGTELRAGNPVPGDSAENFGPYSYILTNP